MLKKNEGNIQTFITNRSGSGCCKYITESRLLVDFLWEENEYKEDRSLFDSCGGFNTPTLCVVTKGIKAECNHLMRTTYPDACVGGVDFIITAVIMNIPFRILVIYPTIKGNQPSDIIARTLISTLLAFSYLIL